MKTIEEDSSSNYAARTEKNAMNADITLAFAIDFSTAGEKVTKKFVKKHSKLYIPIGIILPTHTEFTKILHDKVIRVANYINTNFSGSNLNFNIAGNGAYTLIKENIDQEYADRFIYLFMLNLREELKHHNKSIVHVRSGGQSGIDEAAIKAASKLNIDYLALLPKGFRLRNVFGEDLTSTYESTLSRLTI
jgi:hypothetical protein